MDTVVFKANNSKDLIVSNSLVFIDKNISDYQTLERWLIKGSEVFFLNTICDGIERITEILARKKEIASIHIVSHGRQGQILIGSASLSTETIDRYATELQKWSLALAEKANIIIYGCEVALGTSGKSLIWRLSELTGATITASTTKTGSSILGGDWDLDTTTDRKKVALAFSKEIVEAYNGILALDDPYLVGDINQVSFGSNPRNFINIGGSLYFIGDNETNGTELWRVDAETGLVSIVEIASGSGSSNPNNLTDVNGTLYFQAYDPTNGYELWKIGANGIPTRIDLGSGGSNPNSLTNINGTLYFQAYSPANGYELWKIDPATGNPVVIEIVSGGSSSSPSNLLNANGVLYFTAYTPENGVELWKLDPTSGNPVFIKDIRVGGDYSNPVNLTYSGGKIYFTADNLSQGRELWVTDGTTEGTALTGDINQNTYSSNPRNFINVGGVLYFIADNDTNGTELWKSDSITGIVSIVDINSGVGSSSPNYLTNVNGTLYFQAYDPTNGYELWKIDENGDPSRINLGNGGSNPNYLTNINGTLYFQAYTPTNGYELWEIDPATGNPVVIEIVSGSGSSDPRNLTNVNGILYFQAYNAATGYELWKLNPANDLPVLVSDLYAGGNSSSPSNFINSGGTVYFIANNGTNGSELYRINAAGNPVLLDIRVGASSSNPNNLIDVEGILYFIANDGINGEELWKVDPSTGNPVLLEIRTGSGGSLVNYLTNVNGTLYFRAYDDTNGYELWKIGTNGNLSRIDLGNGSAEPSNLTKVNGTLYFQAYTPTNGYELWKIDPTTGDPSVIEIISGGGSSYPDNLTEVGGTLYFRAYNPANGYELWKLNSSGNPVLVKDIRTGGNSSSPSNLFNVEGTLYFTADDGVNGLELWKSDGTTAGTVRLDIYSGANSPNIGNLVNSGGTLFFTSDNGTNGRELWRINTTTGNPEVLDINSGSGSSSPNYLIDVGGTLYFQAYTPTNGYELWKVTAEGTPELLNLGNGGSNPNYLTNVNGTLYFQAYTPTNGYELWKIDSATGSPSVIDIVAGGGSSSPNNLTNVDGILYFTAQTYDGGGNYLGVELWKIDPNTGSPVFLEDIRVGSNSSNIGNLTYSSGKLYFTADEGDRGAELWAVDVDATNTIGTVEKTGDEDEIVSFASSDFASVFNQGGGTSLAKIQVIQLSSNGILKLGANDVLANQEIDVADLGNLTFIPNANFNGTAGFTWNGSDGTNYAVNPSNVIFTINSINDAPELVNPIPDLNFYSNGRSSFTVSENAFRDVDLGDSLTYAATLADGSPLPNWLNFNDRTFSGNPPITSAGQLEIKVTATDRNGVSASDNFILNVINSAPTFISLSNSTIPENSAEDTLVGTLTSSDANANDEHTYTLVNDVGGRFAIDGERLIVANSSLLDYEAATVHTIRIRTTDSSGLAYERDINVFLSNVNDSSAGVLSFSAATYSVNEDGVPVASITVTRTGGNEGFVRADILLGNGTANFPNDYNTTSIPVAFGSGETSKTVVIPIIGDVANEENETIELTLANPQGGATLGTQTTAVLTIIDNDGPTPDLVASDVTAPAAAISGRTVEVSWTVTNEGTVAATGTWFDNLFASSDDEIGNDIFLGSFAYIGTLDAGESIVRTQSVTLPFDWSSDRYFVVTTDAGNGINEGEGENNNTAIASQPIDITLADFPNLVVSEIDAPAEAFSGLGTEVVWTVTNQGDAATNSPFWRDEVWLSRDDILDTQGDYFLGSVVNPNYLGVGESYTNRLNATLPRDISGDWHFIVRTDASNSVNEYPNDSDNITVAEITNVELTPPADLQVTNITLAPTRPFSGQQATISWRVTNTGTGATPPDQTVWNDEMIMTENADGTGETFVLGTFQRRGSLAAGASYDVTQTVNLPIGKWGNYFFSVRTDRNGQVFESAFEENNTLVLDTDANDTEVTPTEVLLTPPPDLVAERISAPANVVAGQLISVSYRITNDGLTATPATTSQWTDEIYLSPTPTFNSNTAISLGTVNRQGILEAQNGYDLNTAFQVPNNVAEGNYYLIVIADAYNRLFEQDDADEILGTDVALPNVVASRNPISVLSRPADLTVSAVNVPPVANAGSTARVSWTVRNSGTGNTPASQWRDRLVASTNDILGDEDDVILADIERTGILPVNGTYTRTEDILLPFSLSQGTYNLFVTTDVDGVVYESNNANNSTSTPLQVNRQTPDLEIVAVNADAAATSGNPLAVSWTVKNTGAGKTNVDFWYDEVYLSSDDTIDSNDLWLGSVRRGGILGVNDTYTVSTSFSLPINLQGTYKAIVRSDNTNRFGEQSDRVIEISEDNNSEVASNSTTVSLSPVADLQVTQIDLPDTAVSGQTLAFDWRVRNFGAATGDRTWTDYFYLSVDRVFDRNTDFYLGAQNYRGNLDSNGIYNGSQTFNLPRGISGNYYLFAVTDANDAVEERDNEANNVTASDAVNIIIPPPSDLQPRGNSIDLPATGVVGQPLNVSYTVENSSNAATIGSWSDTIYLSKDAVWDIDDLAIGTFNRNGDLAAGATYNGSIVGNLPAVVPGDYYAIVRSDIRNQAPESNETNNTDVSLEQISIDVPALNLGGSVSGSLAAGQAVYYKLEATAGQAIRLQFDSSDNSTTNQIYVRYGEMPTRGLFDVTDDKPFIPDPDFVLPVTQTGTYYVLAYGNTATAASGYTLSATEIPFSVFDVSADVVGNDNIATIKIDGAKFGDNTIFELIDSQGNAIAQTKMRAEDSTTAFATFDLTDKIIGSYSLRATQSGETVILDNALQIQQGDLVDDFTTGITGPRAVWAGQKYPVNIAYGNAGDSDISAPLLLVRPVNDNAAIGYNPRYDASEQRGKTLQFLGAGEDLGLTQLRPGESYTVPVFYTHMGGEDSAGLEVIPVSRYDNTAISAEDWVMLRDSVKPEDIGEVDWNNFWASRQAGIGNSWGDYVELVTELSSTYSGSGNPITDVRDLFDRWYENTDEVFDFQPKSTISGRLFGPEGILLKEVRLDVTQVLPDGTRLGIQNSTDIITDAEGRFTFQGLEAGNYEVSLSGSDLGVTFLPTVDGLTDLTPEHLAYDFTVTEGQNQSDLDIQTYEPSTPDFIADRQVGQKQVSLVNDGDGVPHVFWIEDGQLWHSHFDGSQWIDAAPISAAQPEGTYKVQASSSLLGGSADLIVTWDERTDDPNNPVPGDTEVFYALGRLKAGGGYEWSEQIAVTPDDNVVGATPSLILDSAGNPLFVYQQFDGNIENDDSDLYYQRRDLSGDDLLWDMGAGQNGSISWSYAFGAEIHLPDAVGRFIPITHVKLSAQYSGSSTTSCDKTVNQGGWNGRGEISNKSDTLGNVSDLKGKGEFKITGGGTGSYGSVFQKGKGLIQRRSQAGGNLGFETTVVPSFLGPVANVLSAAQNVVGWFGGDLETGINGSGGVNRVSLTSPTGSTESWAVNVNAGIYGKLKFGSKNGLWSAKPPTLFEFKLSGGVAVSLNYVSSSSQTSRAGQITGRIGARGVAELKAGQFSLGPIKFEPIVVSAGIEGFISFPDCTAVWDVWTNPLTPADAQPILGTTNIYGGNAVLSSVGEDVYNDSGSVLTQAQNGSTYMAWSKQFYDPELGVGEAVTVASFDGNNWSEPVTLARNAMLQGIDITTAANGLPLVMWSMADENAFVLPQDPSTIDSIEEVTTLTQAVADSTNLFYSTIDAAGNWSDPIRIADIEGADRDLKLGQTSDGRTIASWVNTDGEVADLQVAFWDGTNWTTPTVIATGNLGSPTVGKIGSQTVIFWSQLQSVSGSDEPEEVLFYSTLDSSNGRWTAPGAFAPLLAGGQGISPNENPSNVISLPGDDRFAPPPEGCDPPYDPPQLRSADPNDILGPVGFGAENWVTPNEPFGYTIRFENMPEATAPAKLVTITQQLDTDLDWRSFRLDAFSWGDIIVEIPEDRPFYTERLDVREQYGIFVDFTAFIDITAGIASWELRAIDPATGTIPTDPLLGFLPPNGTTPEDKGRGEGYVTYSIKSGRNITHGARIDAEAEIIFDNNEPIKTPAIFNTIDSIKPTATIQPLPANIAGDTFTLNWSGSDNEGGSGLAYYDIYVSIDDAPYELLLDKTTQTELTVTGDLGSKYEFIAVGKDNAQSLFCYRCEGLVDPDAPILDVEPQTSIVLGTPGEIAFSQSAFRVTETGGAFSQVTLTRTGGSFGEVSVTLTPSNGTAIGGTQPFADGVDFDDRPIIVTFANGEKSKVVKIPLHADSSLETEESLNLSLNNATGGATLGSSTEATLNIVDNTSQITFGDTNFRLVEGRAVNEIQILRVGSSAKNVSATLNFSSGTATSSNDFDGSLIEVNFAANEAIKTIVIPLADDTVAEGLETFSMSLTDPKGGAALGSIQNALVTVADDDTALKFNFAPDEGMSATAIDAFTRAANRWTTLLNSNVTLNLNISFRDMGTGTIGQTSSFRSNFSYAEVRDALAANGSSADDLQAIANLPTDDALNLLLNRITNSPYGSGSPTPYIDNDGDANNTTLRLNRANAKALGLLDRNGTDLDATIIFNNNAAIDWDFDPSDGISEGTFDFVGMAAHEIAHALGFDSGVDVLDSNPATSDDKLTFVSALDLFRFSPESYGYGAGTIDWTANDNDKYFSLDGGATKIASFATGRVYGDGYQPSHWKDGLNLGIMDPTIETGEGLQIAVFDLRALDAIGWNLSGNSNNNESPTDLSLNNSNIAENSPVGTVVGTFSTKDPDANDSFTYSLVAGEGDTDNAAFTIVDGELRLAATLDYETKNSYSILVETRDSAGSTYEKSLTISVNDVNEAPIVTKEIFDRHFLENKSFSFTFTRSTFRDVDSGDSPTFAATLADGSPLPAWLNFDANTRTFSGTATDADAGERQIKVTATDKSGLFAEEIFDLTIFNLIRGNNRNNNLTGTADADLINGLKDNDTIDGGDGGDLLIGKLGTDTLTGGSGRDRFGYHNLSEGGDFITDFNTAEDSIVMKKLFESIGYTGSDPIADSYLVWIEGSSPNELIVQIDPDGINGDSSWISLVTLKNVNSNSLNLENFVF